MAKKSHNLSPSVAAFLGMAFSLPFILLNTIVGNRIEPFMSFIRPSTETSFFELVLLATAWLLLPAGAFTAICPMIQDGKGGKWKFYMLNSIIAAILLILFIMLSGVWSEIYRCDVLRIPNCD